MFVNSKEETRCSSIDDNGRNNSRRFNEGFGNLIEVIAVDAIWISTRLPKK